MTAERFWLGFIVIFFIVSVSSWFYLWQIYKHDPEPQGSWILAMLQQRALIDVIAIGTLSILFLRSAIMSIPRDNATQTISGLCILALATGPSHKAIVLAFYRRRLRRRYQNTIDRPEVN